LGPPHQTALRRRAVGAYRSRRDGIPHQPLRSARPELGQSRALSHVGHLQPRLRSLQGGAQPDARGQGPRQAEGDRSHSGLDPWRSRGHRLRPGGGPRGAELDGSQLLHGATTERDRRGSSGRKSPARSSISGARSSAESSAPPRPESGGHSARGQARVPLELWRQQSSSPEGGWVFPNGKGIPFRIREFTRQRIRPKLKEGHSQTGSSCLRTNSQRRPSEPSLGSPTCRRRWFGRSMANRTLGAENSSHSAQSGTPVFESPRRVTRWSRQPPPCPVAWRPCSQAHPRKLSSCRS
jgi:hypothetical protein